MKSGGHSGLPKCAGDVAVPRPWRGSDAGAHKEALQIWPPGINSFSQAKTKRLANCV